MWSGLTAMRYKLFAFLLMTATAFGQVTADFGNRVGGTVIPQTFLGTNVGSISSASPLVILPAAGLNYARLFVSIAQDCTGSSGNPATDCSWSIPNAQLTLLAAAKLKVLINIEFSNTLLGAAPCSPPNNNSTWAGYVNAFLSQAAANFPGTVYAVELWNEPDNGTSNWCPGAGTNLSTYESFIGSAGPAVATANPSLLVGGPALCCPGPNAATWIPGVIGAWPGIQFVSWHLYLGAQTSWANYLSAMQSTTAGIGFYDKTIDGLITGAGSAAPSWLTEFNNNPNFALDCCRNDPTFGPLWNALALVDHLNAIATSGSARLNQANLYFTDQGTNSCYNSGCFCIAGQWDGAMDCQTPPSGTAFQLYPQFNAYRLFGAPEYLNLATGGNLAASWSPGSTLASLSAAAFYTAKSDAVVIVNPTASPVATGLITFNNAGISNAVGTMYTLNGANTFIVPGTIALTVISGGYTTPSITIPANTTIALTLSSPNANRGARG